MLYGNAGKVSNCKSGPPIDKQGQAVRTAAGAPDVDAQPPCFLRYSPAMFAAEAPAMFAHDDETNALSLRDSEGGYPWISERAGEWLYCEDCYERWLSTSERSRWHFVPFRDKASQGNLKPSWNHLKRRHEELERDCRSQGTPDDPPVDLPEGAVEEDASIFDADPTLPDVGGLGAQTLTETPADDQQVLLPQADSLNDLEPKVELPEIEVERPSLQEYQAKWDNLLEHHSRSNEGLFSDENLCPSPVPQLWRRS